MKVVLQWGARVSRGRSVTALLHKFNLPVYVHFRASGQ